MDRCGVSYNPAARPTVPVHATRLVDAVQAVIPGYFGLSTVGSEPSLGLHDADQDSWSAKDPTVELDRVAGCGKASN